MSIEQEKLIINLPFIKKFVFEAIKVSSGAKINEKDLIDTELVPKFSKHVIQASMNEMVIPPRPKIPEGPKKPLIPKMFPKTFVVPNRQKIMKPAPIVPVTPRQVHQQLAPPKPFIPARPKPVVHRMPPVNRPPMPKVKPVVPKPPASIPDPEGRIEGYGKINPFLEDQSVSSVECPGPGKPVVIVRAGQRQITRIVLGPTEIKEILETVADEAHIPLLEGVFRAAVQNFSISAVISEMIGSKFVIKKLGDPYS